MEKKVLLVILDGWGVGERDKSNAIYAAGTPQLDALMARYPHAVLGASGEDVGLPVGQMGNSEVGHLNIGAGRVVYQDLVKINRACREDTLWEKDEVVEAFEHVKRTRKKLHIMGLLSNGGVHSSMEHLYKLCELTHEYGLRGRSFVHCFMDGRDTDPRSGKQFIAELRNKLRFTDAVVATIIGRYYAMDRDGRWDRVKRAYDLLVHGVGKTEVDAVTAMQRAYNEGETDEFISPISIVEKGKIGAGDTVIFFNFRNDRAKELTRVLTQEDMVEYDMKRLPLHFCTMTPYDDKFEGLHVLFDKEKVVNTLGEVVAASGRRQLRVAETEKYAHVTFFLSGGREEVFGGEDRLLIPSPKVATYDLQPSMSAVGVKDAVVGGLRKGVYDFVAVNFANGDMVGHTGVYDAICEAVRVVDSCVGEVVSVARECGYSVVIIADHGNADVAVNRDGSPNTAHSLNTVPIIVAADGVESVADGVLADVAPTVLELMGLHIPREMEGEVLTN